MPARNRVDDSSGRQEKLPVQAPQELETSLHLIDFSKLKPSFFPKLDVIRDTAKTEYDVLSARGIAFFPSTDTETEKLFHGLGIEGVVSGEEMIPHVRTMNLDKRREAEQKYEIDRRYAEKCLKAFLTWKVATLIREAAEKRDVDGNTASTDYFYLSSEVRHSPELEPWFGQEANTKALTPAVVALSPHDPIGANRVSIKINQEKAYLTRMLTLVTHEIVSALKQP